jgi:hypothetical protein
MLPHRDEELVRVLRVHHEIGRARGRVHVEDLRPRRAAVGGLEEAALLALGPGVPQRGHVHDVRVVGVDHDVADGDRAAEAHERPRLPGVERPVDAGADAGGVAPALLAGPDPDDVRAASGTSAMAPTEAVGRWSVSGVQVTPPFTVFQSPPVAAPT